MKKLALHGGIPACQIEWPAWPQWDSAEENALVRVVRSTEWGTLAPEAVAFAGEFANYVGTSYGLSVVTGTKALELALCSLNIGYGDEVIVPGYTFVATISSIANIGAIPVIVDIDPTSGNISPAAVEAAITPRTTAIIGVHFAGCPFDVDALRTIADRHGLALIEDAAHAHGAVWRGKMTGSLGDIAAFSFQKSKNLTGGEGGAITTDRKDLYERAWQYHNSGRAMEGSSALGGLVLMGSNLRMADWAAGILREQLKKLPAWIVQRTRGAQVLNTAMACIPGIQLQKVADAIDVHAWCLFPFCIEKAWLKEHQLTKTDLINAFTAEGIPASSGYVRLNEMGFLGLDNALFRKTTGSRIDYANLDLPGLYQYVDTCVWLPGKILLAQPSSLTILAKAISKVIACGHNIKA